MMKAALICVFLFVVRVQGVSLPKYIKTCSINSPNFKECAIKNGNEAISHLVEGDRSYGIPSFKPFRIPYLTISSNGLEMNLTDASFSGIDTLKMQDYIFDPVKKFSSTTLRGPVIGFEFDFSTKGKIGPLPIAGTGHGWAKFFNTNYTYAHEFDLKTKNGKHYVDIGKNEILIEPERVECELGNLFNGNKQLGDNLNKFLNENWRELLKEFGPVITEINGAIIKQLLRKFYDKIPLEDVFPGIVL